MEAFLRNKCRFPLFTPWCIIT